MIIKSASESITKNSGQRSSSFSVMQLASLALAGTLTMLLFSPARALADDDSTAGSAPPTTSATPVKAGVQMIELDLSVLRDLGLDIKNILKASSSLYDEVTIQPVSIMTEPTVVGMGTIVNIPIGFQPTGAGPQPAKKRVDMAMNQMRPIIQLLKQDVDDFESGRARLDISASEKQELQPVFDDWINHVNDISTNLDALDSLTKGPPYDNNGIASAAGTIHKDSKQLDELRRKLYKWLQKKGKKKSKNA